MLPMVLFWTTSTMAEVRLTGRSITTRDGLPSNRINDMIQDKTGYIWLGTSNGLCRYDGYSFMNLQTLGNGHDHTIGNVGTIHLDEKNNLMWIRTATFNYACYDLQRGSFTNYYGACDPHKTFERFIAEEDGIWMYEARAGIRHVTYRNGKFECRDYTQGNGSLPESKIKILRADDDGHVWALTDKGLLRTDANNEFRQIVKDGDFMMWSSWKDKYFLLTRDSRVLVFNHQGKQVGEIAIPSEFGNMARVNSNFVWKDKWIIITRSAVIVMDCNTMKFEKPAEWQMSFGLLLDQIDGNYWVSDISGILRVFPSKGDVKTFELLHDSGYSASQRRNFATIRGNDGRFYIATYGNGLFIYDPKKGQTEHYSANDQHPIINSNYLINIHQDRDGNIWVGQEDAGIVKISQNDLADTSILLPDPNNRGEKTNYITNFYKEKDGSIIISTKSTKNYRLFPNSGEIVQTETKTSNVFYTDSISDETGRMWIATWEQGLLMAVNNKGKREEVHLLTKSISESRINAMAIDKNGILWVATYNGIYYTDTKQKNITSDSFRHISSKEGLTSNDIVCLLTAKDGSTWAGGIGTGLVRCILKDQSADITILSTKHGLSSNNIHSLAEDNDGNIWAGTDEAMTFVDVKTMKPANFQVGTTMLNNIYSDDCAITLDDGRMLFGTHDGITVINPGGKHVVTNKRTKAFITNIEINGTSIFNDEQYEDLRTMSGDIVLDYNENSLKFYISSFDFAPTERATYQYYMKGIDRDWREPSTQHSVDYGNLPPGRYTFFLKSEENDEVTTLNIRIREPWYNSWWAWIIYLALIGSVGGIIYRHKRREFKLHQQMKIDKQVSEFRASFFTQVAHEFRTPLAIIQGAVDKLYEEGNTQKKPIQTAKRGVRRLTQLVNQLMEFRKINTGNLRLRVEKGDIVGFVRDIYQDFWNAAQQKELSLTYTPFDKKYETVFDRHILDTITYNLFSNAIKYTPQHGAISIRLKRDGGQLQLIVEDSGPGIDSAREQELFKPFMHGYASQGGMGIGLYTAYRMAQTHKGCLTYRRSESLGGSRFTFSLPDDESSYEAEDYKTVTAIEKPKESKEQLEQTILEMQPQALNDHHIAIIEDDTDMLEQIKSEIGVYFIVDSYTDGKSGLDGLLASPPSLLVCDVMLPDMSGYDIVKKIRQQHVLRNIPIMMLTALDDERHQIKGYEAGADDYMVKPCNYHILIARIVQLIKWNRRTESRVQAPDPAEATGQGASPHNPDSQQAEADSTLLITSKADKRLLEKINAIIAQHISDSNFSVDQMAEMMKMGRTKFYGKVKELTGESPNKLLIAERMRLAAQLLEEGELNISEISYRVGIEDASYFNKCFKQHFGMSPSQYKKQK